MITFNLIRMTHLLLYFLVAVQLVYYFYLMGDALQLVRIESFLDERRIVHPLVMQRHQLVYYACLLTSLVMVGLSWRDANWFSLALYGLALVCLVADVVIALKGNNPINTQVQEAVAGLDWEALRSDWIRLIKIRGGIISVGMLSLFVGLVFGK